MAKSDLPTMLCGASHINHAGDCITLPGKWPCTHRLARQYWFGDLFSPAGEFGQA